MATATTPNLRLPYFAPGAWREDGSDAALINQFLALLDVLVQTEEDVISVCAAQSLTAHTDVDAENVQNGDVLGWDSTSRKWKNYPPEAVALQYVDGGTF